MMVIKRIAALIMFVMFAAMLWLALPNSLYAASDYRFVVNGKEIVIEEKTYIENGRMHVPVRFVAESLGSAVSWNQEAMTAEIASPIGDVLSFKVDHIVMKLNGKEYLLDTPPFLREGRTYLPIRHVAELLHMQVGWDPKQGIVNFSTVPLYTAEAGDTIHTIAEKFGNKAEWLMERNGLQSDQGEQLEAGQAIKVVIPGIISKKQNSEELYLLAKIIFAEAGYESIEGQVAVGNVILNRMKDPRFPSTIRDVIYQPHQFTPAHNGSLEAVVPSESSIWAAQQALTGKNYVSDALYFFNPIRQSSNAFFQGLHVVIDIGNHRFAK
jgi:N-acetylmuramoyl-L-alanine amidase